MTAPLHGPELPDPPYKSTWRNEAMPPWADMRDARGRFLPKFSGAVCDWMGCLDPIEAPGRRFCARHRAAHGQRLLGQLQAITGGR